MISPEDTSVIIQAVSIIVAAIFHALIRGRNS
ncbi:MAG: hypothetical protein [Arizlama microvirus]|nr:MAG: hypothetical protein [Arizlama microvirus]